MTIPTKWSSPFPVDTIVAGDQKLAAIAALANGEFVATWSSSDNSDVKAQIFHADGSKDGGEFTINTSLNGTQTSSDVAARPDGGFVAVWLNEDSVPPSVWAQIFHADGSKQGVEIAVGIGADSTQPSVIVLSNGNFLVAWDKGNDTGNYARLFDANGGGIGNALQVTDPVGGAQGDASAPVISAIDGKFVVAWTETDGTHSITHTQLYANSGAKIGADLQVVNPSQGHEHYPAVASLEDGSYVIAWEDSQTGNLRAQHFNPDGTEAGSSFTIKAYESGTSDHQVTLTGLSDGRFVAAWTHGLGVEGRVFNPDGTPSDDFFTADATPAATDADLTALADGRFVLSWRVDQQLNGPDPGYGIQAQIFDPREDGVTLDGSNAFNDELIGGAFDDFLFGKGGNDHLDGGDGKDSLVGGAGGDVLIGGPGSDTARYNGSPAAVHIDLYWGLYSGGDATGDFLMGIENVIGSPSDDTLSGDSGDNELTGGPGADILDGRAGTDTARYDFSNAAVTISLSAGIASGGDAAGDQLSNIENLTGSSHDDTLIGDSGKNLLRGGGGSDTLKGGGGADTLEGGSGIDTAIFTGSHSDYTLTQLAGGGVKITDLRFGAPDGVDTLYSIEKLSFSDGTVDMPVFANQAPVITSNGGGDLALIDVAENTTAVTTVHATDADPVTYSVVNGYGDGGKFQINAATGELSFINAPDYEAPTDIGQDNHYVIEVAVSDGALIDSQVIVVNVTDVAPVINGDAGNNTLFSTPENDTIDGKGGDDTVVFSQTLDKYTVTDLGTKITVAGPDGPDVLYNVEHLQFADGTINVVDGSAVFDTAYYMSHNLDVFHAGLNALDHFNTTGWHEGRDPNAFFSVNQYLAANADVKAAGMNPLDHYHQIGWQQGRDPSANFDTKLYLIHNPDVAAAGIDPLEQYLQHGMAEGRQAYQAIGDTIVNGFDAEYYLMHNPDVAASGIDPLVHFQQFGWHEGRNPNGWFDAAGYLAHYSDVAASGMNPLDHYETVGWKEGRDPSAGFDTLGYLAQNPDVAAAGINPLDHFLQSGIYEGRAAVNDGVWH